MATEKQQQVEKGLVEYVPFGGDSKIKLSIEIVKRLVSVKTKSGRNCSDEDAIKFIAMCQARKLNPWEGDAFLIGYDNRDKPDSPNFSLITSHQAFLKRAECNTAYDGMESGVVVEQNGEIKEIQGDLTTGGQKVIGGWARVFRKDRKHPMYKRIRLSRFQKPFGVWQDDPGGMICKCAEADALRSSFPTMLGGLYLREEQGPPTIEISEPKIVDEPISNGREAPREEQQISSPPMTESPKATAAPPSPSAPPVRKRSSRLKPKEQELPAAGGEPMPNRVALNQRLSLGGYNETQFLEIANKNEWLGKGRVWDSLNDVPDDMLSVFLADEEWTVVQAQLEKMPRHTKD